MRAVGVLAFVAGCYAPAYAPCSIRCGDGGACPADTHCGTHGYCERETGERCLARYQALSVGGRHACAIRWDGTLCCWGFNRGGQLGNGRSGSDGAPDVADENQPVDAAAMTGTEDWLVVRAGGNHTCGIRRAGKAQNLWCWGWNERCQLGGDCPA